MEDTSAVLSVAEKSPFEGEPENFAPATKSASGNVLDSFSARFRAARFSSLKKPDEDHNYSMSQIDDVNPKTDAASKRHNIPMSGDSQELQSPKSILKLRSSNLGTLTQNSPKTVNFKESPSIAKSSSLHLDSRSLNLSSDGARIEELPSKDESKSISGPATSGVVAPTITPDREDSNVASSQGFALSYSRSVSTAPASAELAFRSESRDNDSIRNAVADCMEEYLLSLKQDLQNMHLDLLKQFHQHKVSLCTSCTWCMNDIYDHRFV